jgi:hypothetical protein
MAATDNLNGVQFRTHISDEGNEVTAHAPEGHEVGHLNWHPSGEMGSVFVNKDMRRQGVASEMWNRAKVVTPGLQHSVKQSPDGGAWAGAVG